MTGFVLLAGALALGLVQMWRLALPPRVNLAASVQRWDKAHQRANRREETGAVPTLWDTVVDRVIDAMQSSGRDLTSMRQDIEITEGSMREHMSKIVAVSVVGLIAGLLAGLIWPRMLHLGFPPELALAAGVAGAVLMIAVVSRELRSKAAQRRAQMHYALSIWLDLVSMCLEGGRDYNEALPTSAAIGSGWAFDLLREATITAPRWEGISAWTALGRLGDRIGVKELSELEGIITLALADGSKVKETLIARASTLRAARVSHSEAAENKAAESSGLTLLLLTFSWVAFLFYPAIAQIYAY